MLWSTANQQLSGCRARFMKQKNHIKVHTSMSQYILVCTSVGKSVYLHTLWYTVIYCYKLAYSISDPASAYMPVFFYTYIHIQTVIFACIFILICTNITWYITWFICHMHISYLIQLDMIIIQTHMNVVICVHIHLYALIWVYIKFY